MARTRPRDFAVSRKSCRLLPLSSETPGRRGQRPRLQHLTPDLFSRSRWEPQKSGQNIATMAPTVSIETRMSSHELTGGGAERWARGFTRRPKTRRRLSGWSSKIRICCIFLRAAFVAGRGCLERESNRRFDCLMTKIFFARMPGCRLTGKGRAKFG